MPITEDTIEFRVDLTKELKDIKDPADREQAARLAGNEALKKLKDFVKKGK